MPEDNPPKKESGDKPKGPPPKHTPGDGIRSMQTSQAFRALNFELYARPNKTIMAVGITMLTISGAYLTYMNYSIDRENMYEATNEDGSVSLRPKKSRWDS